MNSVCFVASNPVFIDPIALELTSKYKVRTFYEHDIRNNEKYLELMEHIRDADVSFFDWCDPNIIEMSKGIKTAKMICRMHSYEFFSGYPGQVNWDNVDRLVLVNHSMAEIMRYAVPISDKKIRIVYHGVDLNKFKLDLNREYLNRVGTAGYINYKKDPSFIMGCFNSVNRVLPKTEFIWAGEHQDIRYQLEFMNSMSRNDFSVRFDPWQKDMNKWFQDIDYILSGSLFESCHMSMLEGMACGVFPLVRWWKGAENIYPSHALFHMPDSCAQRIFLHQKNKNRGEIAALHRKWIQDFFPFEKEVEEIDKVIQEVINE